MFENRFRCLFLNQIYKALDKSVVAVNLPSVTSGVAILQSPIKDIYYPGNSLEFSDLNINFQLDENYDNWKNLMGWIKLNKDFSSTINDIVFSDISLQLADAKKNIIYSVQLKDCFPFDMSAISFDTRMDALTPIIFDVSFKVNNMDFE